MWICNNKTFCCLLIIYQYFINRIEGPYYKSLARMHFMYCVNVALC